MPEVTPIMNDKGDILDFQVTSRPSFHNGTVDEPSDFIQRPDGRYEHRYQNIDGAELERRMHGDSNGTFNQSDYEALVLEADPEASYALDVLQTSQLAQEMMGMDKIRAYQQALRDGNLDGIHQGLEQIKEIAAQVQELEDAPNEDEVEEDLDENDRATAEWFDNIPDEVLDNEIDSLMDVEGYSEDEQQQMSWLLDQQPAGSVEADILEMGLAVANGQIGMADAINAVVDKHGDFKSAAAYVRLQQVMSLR